MSKVINDKQTIQRLLERGVEEVIEKEHVQARLENGEQLRVKLGIDPTAKDLHLGHTVVLRKLKQFQDAGHKAVFIIGDFTATIGDPSGKNELRPALNKEEVKENLKNYLKEAGKVIDIKKAEVRYNSEWYSEMKNDFFLDLTRRFTVARILERDDFQKRLESDQDISIMEILYPILQGYDSLEVKADLELGGTDQKFNLLMGRKVQKKYDKPEQDIMTLPLIEGLDGVKKMSKSLNNYIGLSETPENMFGKIMSIPDSLIEKYFNLLTDAPEAKLEEIKNRLIDNPMNLKEELGFEVVRMYHGEKEAQKARDYFKSVFSEGLAPENMDVKPLDTANPDIISFCSQWLEISRSEVKRLLEQRAIYINGSVAKDWDKQLQSGDVLKAGPHKFVRVN